MRDTLAIGVQDSGNSKVATRDAPVSATYVSQASCPADCPLGDACYARFGRVALVTNRLASVTATPEDCARAEALAIDNLDAHGQPLRLHVVGDCATPQAAFIVGQAARRFVLRGGGPVYTYTHAWRHVHRKHWGAFVTVLASLESPDQIWQARAMGYAMTALVVAQHDGSKAWTTEDGDRVVPCPSQTGDRHCVECRLCFRERALTVALAAHGAGRSTALRVIQG